MAALRDDENAGNLGEEERRLERITRRQLRDTSDPLCTPESAFISYYRLNKSAFLMILNEISPSLSNGRSIPATLQLATALRFLAVGSFQGVIGKDFDIALGRTTVCKVLWRVLNLLESKICPNWIKLRMTESEILHSKSAFFDKFGIPGIVGCMDGTHIKIIKPTVDESLFYNRKGYFSINALIICDNNMNIRYIDATRPGSSHDSFIWNMSDARAYFLQNYMTGTRGSWLLADSGYALEPFVLTPYKQPSSGSIGHVFNQKHTAARNIIERTIGVLKSRFRCIQGTLHYRPLKCVKITNICCALHNICRAYNIVFEEPNMENVEAEISSEDYNSDEDLDRNLLNEANNIRNRIAESLRRT